ncbi:MAG TPA: hypothetical protein VHE59_07930 [Mucilaginibacter sp.]|nr:hypothetical protein [Mucilaginibacter sp.]
MIITKDELQHIVDTMPDKADIEEVFDTIILSSKIEQALQESEQGLGVDWEDFKKEWLKGSH